MLQPSTHCRSSGQQGIDLKLLEEAAGVERPLFTLASVTQLPNIKAGTEHYLLE